MVFRGVYWQVLLVISFLWLTFLTSGCSSRLVHQESIEDVQKKPANAGFLLRFTEKRPNEPEANLRMVITDTFVRMDEGPNSQDFILFNRKNKTIYNIVTDDQSILRINPGEQNTKAAYPMQWVITSQNSQALMRTQNEGNSSATHYSFNLNDQACYNQVTTTNSLTEALEAIREYNQVLANELKRNYTMVEGQQCYEAIHIFDPNVRLQHGFPLREWSADGYRRFLINVKRDIIFPESMFILPDHYQMIRL